MELIDIENIDYVRLEDSLHCLEHHKGDEVECVICASTVEAIPKAEYEAKLKADMVDMLEEIKKEMNPIKEAEYQIYGKEHWNFVGKCQDVCQQKINKLKGNENGNE